MTNRTPLDDLKNVLAGTARAIASQPEIEVAFTADPPSQSGTKLTAISLEAAGVPVLSVDADMVDARNWNHDRMVSLVEEFLLKRGLA